MVGVWLVAMALPAGAAAVANADLEEAAGSPEAAGDGPAAVASADFNGDTNADLAVANQNADSVTILLGDGLGGFTPAPLTSPEAVGDQPSAIAVGQFDAGTTEDLAVANSGHDSVTILLGNGLGDFTPAPVTSPEAVGDQPSAVAVGLLDGDANQDLVVANRGGNNVSVLLGTGTGDFAAAGTSPEVTGGLAPVALVLANLDGNASQDLAVANSTSNSVSILLGTGTGDFAAAGTSPEVAVTPNSITAANFDGDGDQDLAVTNGLTDSARVLLGNGAGDFTAGASLPVGALPSSIVTADLEDDGGQDLVVANSGSDDVTLLVGDGAGAFSEPATSPEAAGNGPAALAAPSLDADGTQDLAVANLSSDDVTILLNSGTGVASADLSIEISDIPDPVQVGETLTYSLTASNDGPDKSEDVEVSNQLPLSVTFQSASAGCSEAAGEVTCTLDTIPRNASKVRFIDVVPNTVGPINDSASVSSATTPDPDLLNDSDAEQTTVTAAPVVKCKGETATIAGGPAGEELVGTPGDDVIAAEGGTDTIRGLDGRDLICGGDGRDTLKGGDRGDALWGGSGDDTLKGGPGRDECHGGSGDDTEAGCETQ